MKGKIAFVLGAAVGYVLGSRAGRERYEQIKRGADSLWHTAPVQRGVGAVRGVIEDRADSVKAYVRRASADAFASFARQAAAKEPQKPARQGAAKPAAAAAETAEDQQ